MYCLPFASNTHSGPAQGILQRIGHVAHVDAEVGGFEPVDGQVDFRFVEFQVDVALPKVGLNAQRQKISGRTAQAGEVEVCSTNCTGSCRPAASDVEMVGSCIGTMRPAENRLKSFDSLS